LPRIAVLSSLFPSAAQPTAGLFIRERMFRVVEHAPLVVIAPQPWFPLQSLIRRFRPGWRPRSPRSEVQQGVSVFYPRFFAVPGAMRWLDGISMALCVLPLLRRLQREQDVGILDAHFAYPCGYAATRLGRWLRLPVSVTLRGTELRQLRDRSLRKLALRAVASATRVFSVSDSLRQLFVAAGIAPDRIHVVGNGVDLGKFSPIDRRAAREELGIPEDAKVLVSVGGLVERKGFHRVIALMPQLRRHVPALHYVIVGGPSAEGDMGPELREQVRRLGLERSVTFTGPLPPERIRVPLSASDLFVLPTRNEGWANVFLEAMACGLPVVTTRVGGNAEVVCRPELGTLVPFDDAPALERAIVEALERQWDRARIVAYARANTWDDRIDALVGHFRAMAAESPARGERGASR
jgi:glycosyltransferase involved in cell wall biosynthesis